MPPRTADGSFGPGSARSSKPVENASSPTRQVARSSSWTLASEVTTCADSTATTAPCRARRPRTSRAQALRSRPWTSSQKARSLAEGETPAMETVACLMRGRGGGHGEGGREREKKRREARSG